MVTGSKCQVVMSQYYPKGVSGFDGLRNGVRVLRGMHWGTGWRLEWVASVLDGGGGGDGKEWGSGGGRDRDVCVGVE